MEPYKLDASLDANKVFVVKRSELEGRFDTEFYKNDYKELYLKLKSLNHYKLKDIAKFSSESWNQKDYFQNEFPYIEISEINLSDGSINNINLLPISEAPSRAKMIVRKNDIIISTTRPTRGAISFLSNINDIKIASTGFAVIREVSNDVSKEFLFLILRQDFILKQFGQRSSGGNYPAITQEELGKVIIPKIEKSIQKQIVDIYNNAYTQKQAKEAEAKALLASIDTYLLNELGITLPEKDNSLEARIFTTKFSEVVGGRFDPDYHQIFYRNFVDVLVCINSKKLSELTSDIFQGVGKDEVEFSEYKLLKVKNIQKGNIIDYSDVEYVRKVPINKILQKGDIISPFIGEAIRQIKFSNFNNLESKFTVDNNTGVIRLFKTTNNEFVCECLNSSIGKIQINRLIGGGGVPFLGSNNVKEILIPHPPLQKQNEIAEHIAGIRTHAKALQQEAEQVLATAKQQVEQMILG